ncbi:MAG: HAD family hydrolase, partial [Chloroflexota bacterium]
MTDSLFLFDIDGTLLAVGSPFHADALQDAVKDVCGVTADVRAVGLAGRTDSEILLDVMVLAGVPEPRRWLSRVLAASVVHFRRHLPIDLRDRVLPGVPETLAWIAARGGRRGLVSGNIEAIAWEKMRAAGLAQHFACGAFGDESAQRADLPPLAVARAERPYQPERVYVIGDTPRDVACGLAGGYQTVAVATGRTPLEELRRCGPAFACATLWEFSEQLCLQRGGAAAGPAAAQSGNG